MASLQFSSERDYRSQRWCERFPVTVSNASSTAYTATDGYWVKQYYPTITGCLKIDYQSQVGGLWTT